MFGTLHTSTAASTIDRVIDQFPADRQAQIRDHAVRVAERRDRADAVPEDRRRPRGGARGADRDRAISNLIREGKTFQIPSMMQVGKAVGMVSLNEALLELVAKKLVAPDEAYGKAVDKPAFEAALKRVGIRPREAPGRPASSSSRSCRSSPGRSRFLL